MVRAEKPQAIAIFGGTFDPVHCGHLAVAEAAVRRFHLRKMFFVPSSHPPHKSPRELAPFGHRYAMVALACASNRRFIPSLSEAPLDSANSRIFYSVDTVAGFRRQYPRDKLYFILGADSFLEIASWKSSATLLDSCDFIVANRPGVRIEALRNALPQEMLKKRPRRSANSIALRGSTMHLLTTVASGVSSTDIRRRRRRGASIHGLVPATVEDYIRKQALYL